VIRRVDLGICPAYEYENDGPAAVALPGAILGGMPALWWAIAPLYDAGWRVLLVWDEFLDRSQDPWRFVGERADAAIGHLGGADLVIGKSLGTFAAPLELPGIWLTPLLNEPEIVSALRARTAPSLLVGGTDDPGWNAAVAREFGEVLELPGADHGLARIDQAQHVADAVAAFSGRLGRGS
jgi:hypothetical protein